MVQFSNVAVECSGKIRKFLVQDPRERSQLFAKEIDE